MPRAAVQINPGERYGRLVVIAQAGRNKENRLQYLCKCDCGNEATVLGKHLHSGNTKSCGCFKREAGLAANTTHGLSKTRLYRIWGNMIDRCERESSAKFPRYGGRGISVCAEWRNDFQAFYDWAMSAGYDPEAGYGECTLDRKDNDGDYCPENCRWATNKQQSLNKECTRKIEHNGETHTLKEWSEITGVNYYTMHERYMRGEPAENILYNGNLHNKKDGEVNVLQQ